VGGARGGLKVYHGDTDHPNSAGGAEVLSVESPDRSTISSIHMVGTLNHNSGNASGATFTGQLPISGNTAVQTFNNLLKYSVHSRIQSLLSSPGGSRDGNDGQGRPTSSGFLFSGSSKGVVSIFDLASLSMTSDSCVFTSPLENSHTALVSGVLPVPYTGGKHIVSGGYDRLVKFWDARVSGRDSCCLDLLGAGGAVTHVTMDELNPHRIIGVASDNVVRIWDTRILHCREPYISFHVGHGDRICDVMQVEGHLLTASRDGTVMSWNMNSGRCVQTLHCNSSTVHDGFASDLHVKASTVRSASLSCARLLHTPLLRPPSVSSSFSEDEGDFGGLTRKAAPISGRDSFSSLKLKLKKEKERKDRQAIATLITGDYGGTVKVWKAAASRDRDPTVGEL